VDKLQFSDSLHHFGLPWLGALATVRIAGIQPRRCVCNWHSIRTRTDHAVVITRIVAARCPSSPPAANGTSSVVSLAHATNTCRDSHKNWP
jgi:hypothetical protein